MHELAEAQDTPFKPLSVVGLVGLDTIVQAVPFQDSTRVAKTPNPVSRYWPTAAQKVAVGHDTPLKTLSLVPLLGLATTGHLIGGAAIVGAGAASRASATMTAPNADAMVSRILYLISSPSFS